MPEVAEWAGFYVITGSAAGALIGLQFVVMTLVSQRPSPRVAEGSAAFATPTIVHFGAVLCASALFQVPWETPAILKLVLGLIGVLRTAYTLIVGRRMRVQSAYQPELEDWIFHFCVPCIAYLIVAVAGFGGLLARHALFAFGAATLLLLFASIHNAWDAVTYHVAVGNRPRRNETTL